MAYEYTDARTGVRYYVEGPRVYRLLPNGGRIHDHDLTCTPPAPPAPLWRRVLAWLQRFFS